MYKGRIAEDPDFWLARIVIEGLSLNLLKIQTRFKRYLTEL